jgi:hypothetical protein
MVEDTAGAAAPQDGGEGTVAALEALLRRPEGQGPKAHGASADGEKPASAEAAAGRQDETDGAQAAAPPEEAPESEEDEGDGPGEDQVTEEADESEGDPEAVIAAPKSWPAEMRAQFAQLPPDLQRVIADRETERDATFNRQVNEAAEKRRAAEAELQAASTERRQYLAGLSAVIGELANQTASDFADIRTTADLEKLAQDDPARYLRWQARREAILAAQAEADALAERERREQEHHFRGYLDEQRNLLLEKMPELGDPKKAKAIMTEGTAYLKEIGFSDQEIVNVVDHRMTLVIRDALAHRRNRAAARTAAEKKVVGVPRVQKPGAGPDTKAERSQRDKAAMTRIARHGTTDEQAAALTRLLEQET